MVDIDHLMSGGKIVQIEVLVWSIDDTRGFTIMAICQCETQFCRLEERIMDQPRKGRKG
jgi:hypothetical protein